MKLKLGDRVRAPGRLSRRKEWKGRHAWYRWEWAKPIEGMFVGVRTYVNGVCQYGNNYDDPTVFIGDEWIKVALLVQDARHAPVPVLYKECEVI